MKEQSENVGATEYEGHNNNYPYAKPEIRYGNQHVPHPTNAAAKKVDHAKVMGQVLKAK